jgi:hypothetical protein
MKMKSFTLIELLIVIAIITLMISILLPSLGRAREQSKRAVCKSNQNQLYKGNIIFANDNKDRFLMGHLGAYQWSYSIYTDNYGYRILGKLIENQIVEAPQAYYCPSKTHPWRSYNTDVNPWLSSHTRSAFSTRPMLNGVGYNVGNGSLKLLPFISELDGEAITSDDISSKHSDKHSHASEGVVTLYSHGNAKFNKFGKWSSLINSLTTPFNSANNANVESLWLNMDDL